MGTNGVAYGFKAAAASMPELSLQSLTHDLSNIMAALALYVEELAKPAVLSPDYAYLAEEIHSAMSTSSRLLTCIGNASQDDELASDLMGRVQSQMQSQMRAEVLGRSQSAYGEISDAELESKSSYESFFLHLRRLLSVLAGPEVRFKFTHSACQGRPALGTLDLERILVNLVHNAREAMPEGGDLMVHVQMAQAESDGHPVLLLAVKDSGPGIAPNLVERIFEDGLTTRTRAPQLVPAAEVGDRGAPGSGTQPLSRSNRPHGADLLRPRRRGLGLTIVRSLVESCQGRIQLKTSSSGCNFQVEIPVTLVMTPLGVSSVSLQKGSAI